MRQMHVVEEVHEDTYIRHLAIFVSFMQFILIMVMDVRDVRLSNLGIGREQVGVEGEVEVTTENDAREDYDDEQGDGEGGEEGDHE